MLSSYNSAYITHYNHAYKYFYFLAIDSYHKLIFEKSSSI